MSASVNRRYIMKKTNCMRIFSLFLVVIMTVSCFGMTAVYATAEVSETYTQTLDFEITSESGSEDGYIVMPRAIDQTFTMTSYHRGADRTYSGSYLTYSVSITDADGNACDNLVKIELFDYNNASARHTSGVQANGNVYGYANIPITSGRVYYFKYTVTSGATRSLRVHMQINSHN